MKTAECDAKTEEGIDTKESLADSAMPLPPPPNLSDDSINPFKLIFKNSNNPLSSPHF